MSTPECCACVDCWKKHVRTYERACVRACSRKRSSCPCLRLHRLGCGKCLSAPRGRSRFLSPMRTLVREFAWPPSPACACSAHPLLVLLCCCFHFLCATSLVSLCPSSSVAGIELAVARVVSDQRRSASYPAMVEHQQRQQNHHLGEDEEAATASGGRK